MDAGRERGTRLLSLSYYGTRKRKRNVQVESPSRVARWPLLRVRPGHNYLVELLSGEWIRLSTHFAGRTWLCPEVPECELCDVVGARSFWYLPAVTEPGRRPCLLELSSQASSDLEQVAKFSFGNVAAGGRFLLSRKTAKSAIRAEAESAVSRGRVIDVSEWGSLLMAVFGFPPLRPLEKLDDYGARIREQTLKRAAVAAAQLRAVGSR